LRAAVEEANALCNSGPPCEVRFNIVEPSANPWKTIRLQTPLPPIRAYALRMDGDTQTAFSGVANPDGPPIEITGGGMTEGDGLLANCYVEIAHLAINGFRRNGISLTTAPGACGCKSSTGCVEHNSRADIHDNFIGTDPTGSVARPNDRGIGTAERAVLFQVANIARNVISGNAKSGIFAIGSDLEVTANRIGLKAHSDEPLPNGASGLYLDRATGRVNLTKNVIAFNHEMGVAIHPQAPYVFLDENRIWGNGALAIDDGLDGPSPAAEVSTPVITSAVFDPATGKTTIRGSAGFGLVLQFFASDARGAAGSGEAQRYLGPFYTSVGFTFQRVFDGDLRGQWITSTASRTYYHPAADVYILSRSSELSAAVQVQ